MVPSEMQSTRASEVFKDDISLLMPDDLARQIEECI